MTGEEFYAACYDILVNDAGAPLARKKDFVHAFTEQPPAVEYRFGGVFGPWGYFYSNGCPPQQVHYIVAPEEKDFALLQIVGEVNAKIAELERTI